MIALEHSHAHLTDRAHSLRKNQKGLTALVERLAPGGRLAGTRRLRGGLGCRSDVVDIERADGSRLKVTLRRFVREAHRSSAPEHVAQALQEGSCAR